MHAQFSNNNFEDVLRGIYSCTDTETEFVISQSHFDSSQKIRRLFDVICYLPQAVNLKFDRCTFNETDEQLMMELRLCLLTTHNIRKLEISHSISTANMMDYLATALCRNFYLEKVVIDGPVNLESQAMRDLKSRQIAIINGVSFQSQHKPGFFSHHQDGVQSEVSQKHKKIRGNRPSV